MKTANVTWTDPTERTNGKPLSLSAVRVELSADQGANFGLLADVVAGEEALEIPDLEDGTWTLRLTCIDTDLIESEAVVHAFDIDTSLPNPVANVEVTLS